MLNDAEQRRLMEIEFALRAHDPRFVQRFEDGLRRRRIRAVFALLTLTVAGVVTVVGLAEGSILAAVVGLTAAGVVVGLWLSAAARRRSWDVGR